MPHIESLCAPGLFGERFEVIKSLGQGARGAVLLAKDKVLFNSLVALKTSHSSSVCQDEQWLYREVVVNRQVASQFVVRIFEVGTRTDLLPFYVMEYMAGGSLKEKIQEGVLPLHKSIALILQILEGAAIIHESGILHNDIKTSNILVGDDNLPKLADFGSQQIADIKKSSQIYGSAHYLAPEGWQGKEGSVHGDIYALGVVIYEILTGVLPFDGSTQAELMYKHLEQEPVHPTDLCNTVPEWLGEYILKMIAKDPYERFPTIRSCQEFLINGMTNPLHAFVDQSPPAGQGMIDSHGERSEESKELSDLMRPADLNETIEVVSQSSDMFPQALIQHEESCHIELRERMSEALFRRFARFFSIKLSRAERSALAIYLAVTTSWFLMSPVVSLTRSLTEISSTSESWLLFALALIMPVLIIGHLTALPFTTLAWIQVDLKAALRVWVRITATCVVSFICFFGFFLHHLQLANEAINRPHFEMEQLHSSLRCALQNLVQAVLLLPESTLYRTDKGVLVPLLTIDTGSAWEYRLPYYLVMAFVAFCTSYISRRYLLQFVPDWAPLMDLAVTSLVLFFSVTSLYTVPFIEEHLTKMRYVIDLNDVVLTFPIPQLLWVLMTWFLVLLVQATVRWISDVRVKE